EDLRIHLDCDGGVEHAEDDVRRKFLALGVRRAVGTGVDEGQSFLYECTDSFSILLPLHERLHVQETAIAARKSLPAIVHEMRGRNRRDKPARYAIFF